ncbi:MAG: histidine kinase [Bacteroidota bacterium]|nr:histidine kinase [Bacteroidota bacterium]
MNNSINRKSFLVYQFTILLLSILFGISEIKSQQNKYKFDKLSDNEDLISNQIQCIIKDKKGFIWFGTKYGGLYRFDGYDFKSYTHKSNDTNSISEFWVVSICDDDDYLWVGTNNGLNRFDKKKEVFKLYSFDPDPIKTKRNNFVWAIHLSRKNELWLGCGKNLNKFDREAEKFINIKTYPKNSSDSPLNTISTLCEDRNGNMWIGLNGGGMDKYDIKNNVFRHYEHDPADSNSLSTDRIYKILEDIEGNIWIATYGGGINKLDPRTDKFYRFQYDPLDNKSVKGKNIVVMAIDMNQMLWLGSSEGIVIFDPSNNIFTDLRKDIYEPSSFNYISKISDIYTDDKGMVWICSFEEGYRTFNENKLRFNHYRNLPGDDGSLSSNEIGAICGDSKGNFWIGSPNGIDILDSAKKKIRHLESDPKDEFSLSGNLINQIYMDKKNYIWVATDRILEKCDPESEKFEHFFDYASIGLTGPNFYEDRNENLWVGFSKGGIYVFNKERKLKKKYLSGEIKNEDPTEISVNKIYEDNNRNIWIGTNQGLGVIDTLTDRIVFFKNISNNIKVNTNVYSICEDRSGVLWIGTNSGGLMKFDPNTKVFLKFKDKGEFGFNAVSGILFDNYENIWVSTEKSITMINTQNETSSSYGLSDGIQGLQFFTDSYFKSKDGEMFFGGSNGFNSFFPDRIHKNSNVPTLVLTDFRIFNNEVKLDTLITEIKEITISYKENFFSFGYAALDYSDPVKNQYAYMLEGVDRDWNYVGNVRTANYTDIQPGEYTFRVKGSNNDGVWNTEGVSIRIAITPPWYESRWFKVLAALSLISGTGFLFRKRSEKIEKEKNIQEEFTRKLIESQEHERRRIAGALHDSLGQNLMIIKNKILFAKNCDKETSYLINMDEISDLTSNAIEEVRAISHNLRPYELERLGLTEAILSIIENLNSTEITVTSEIDNIDNVLKEEFEINFYRIIQECVCNILKHSKTETAYIKIKKTNNSIEIIIKDNGIGFDTDDASVIKKGMGLIGIQERVNILKGQINLSTEKDKGTEYKITIPV